VVSFLVQRFLKSWLPVLVWMLFIFIGSTDLLSAEHTSRFIGPFLRWFVPDISGATVSSIQLVVRKCAHLTEYAILAVLLWRAFKQNRHGVWRAAGMALFVAALYASLDEFHQSYIASRTGSPWDVLIDCGGAVLGLMLCCFRSDGGTFRQLTRAVRPLQWTKNALLLLPVLLAHEIPSATGIAKLAAAILAFSLFASGVYVLNDLLDLQADRQHPRKRMRPFAAGALTLRTGVTLAIILPALGLALALAVLPLSFSAILALYGCATLSYSLYLKRAPIIDVITLAALHTLRIIAGAHVLPGIDVSGWLLGFSFLFFLSLAFAKRFAEIHAHSSVSAMQLPGRGYYSEHLSLVRALGWGSAFGALLVIAFYLGSDKVQTLYRHPVFLWLTCPAVILWLGRIWLLAQRGKLHDDPVVFALSDPISYFTGVAILIVAVLAV
jgi:4-hydroxybenzoate polyprenyltransferase/VanZ family protein